MPSPPSSSSFDADMRRQTDLGAIWSAIKWGVLAALFLLWGFWLVFFPSPRAEPGSQLFGVAFLVGGAIGLAFIVRIALQRLTPGENALDKELSVFGDPNLVAAEIDVAFAGKRFRPRRVEIAGDWLCYVGKGLTVVRRLDRLIWAYKLRLSHRLNGIIPYRVSYDLIVWDRDGCATAIPGSSTAIDKTLQNLHVATPWLLLGYSETLKESWNSDRADLILYIDNQRQRHITTNVASE